MNYHINNYRTYAVTSNHRLANGVFQKITRTYVVPQIERSVPDCVNYIQIKVSRPLEEVAEVKHTTFFEKVLNIFRRPA